MATLKMSDIKRAVLARKREREAIEFELASERRHRLLRTMALRHAASYIFCGRVDTQSNPRTYGGSARKGGRQMFVRGIRVT